MLTEEIATQKSIVKPLLLRSFIAVSMGLLAACWAAILMELLTYAFSGNGLNIRELITLWPPSLLVLVAAYTTGILGGPWFWHNRKSAKVELYVGIVAWLTFGLFFVALIRR